MKISYYFRVFFVSYEFVFLLLSLVVYLIFKQSLSEHFSSINLNPDAVDWAAVYPLAVSGWTLRHGVGVLFPDDKNDKILHEWPDYWKLKAHFDVGVFNSVAFLLPCLFLWFSNALNTFLGAWFFVGFSGALSINAFSFYAAKINLRSALIRLRDQ